MFTWFPEYLQRSGDFMPHGHCYLWIPSILWLHVMSDTLIGLSYMGISLVLYQMVRRVRLPFSPVFIAFGLFIALCGLTHFMSVWTVWRPDYLLDGFIKAATAAASVATSIGLVFVLPKVERLAQTARLAEERRLSLESANLELQGLYEKVKELDEHKTRFFGNVSHELRTPLALILGPVERLLADAGLTPGQKRQLEGILRNANTLKKHVDDLLYVMKLDAGRMPLQYVRLDIAQWLRRIGAQFELAAEQRQIDFQVAAPDMLAAEVDPDMLERIVVNLLSNAFKFTPRNGRIRLELERTGSAFRIAVMDTGPGIPAEQQEIIFERFRQADASATREHGGTGLGLAIVKELLSLHGGGVTVASSPGQGARFEVELPLAAPAGAAVEPAPQAPMPVTAAATEALSVQDAGAEPEPLPMPVAERATVLAVEDNRDMRSFVAGILGRSYNVATATDGRQGLDQAIAMRPDLVITDLMMPGMSGDELVAALRSRSEFDAVPILCLTARADDGLRISLLESGAQDYLTKPFLGPELLARAGNLIAMKRAGDALRSELASASGDLESLATQLARAHRRLQTALDAAEVAREQAEQADRVKTHFLGMISHELRTPLATILLNAQLLAHPKRGELPEACKPGLERLTRAARQIATLIEELLEFTRIESGVLVLQPQMVDAAALVREVVDAQADHAAPGVMLKLEEPHPGPEPFQTDPRLLRVVLANLVSNALKFTERGTVTVRQYHKDDAQVFEIRDTGIGIPDADLSRIFLPFEQLEPLRQKSRPGVGLGLALVRQIIEKLGGKVDVASAPAEGSVFTVCLPRKPPGS